MSERKDHAIWCPGAKVLTHAGVCQIETILSWGEKNPGDKFKLPELLSLAPIKAGLFLETGIVYRYEVELCPLLFLAPEEIQIAEREIDRRYRIGPRWMMLTEVLRTEQQALVKEYQRTLPGEPAFHQAYQRMKERVIADE